MLKALSLILCAMLSLNRCLGEEFLELSYILNSESALWPSKDQQPFQLITTKEGYSDIGYWYSNKMFCSPEHTSTHVDAPFHFSRAGWKLHEIPLRHLIAPAIVIDIRKKVEETDDPNYELTAADVVEWVDNYGPLPNNSIVLVQTGWSNRYSNKAAYFGHPSDPKKFSFPGIDVGAVQTLLGYRETSNIHIVGVGIDTPSLDNGRSQTYPTHVELFNNNVYGIENLYNLHAIPLTGVELTVMPMKIEDGTGSPCRVIARFNRSSATSMPPLNTILAICCVLFVLHTAS